MVRLLRIQAEERPYKNISKIEISFNQISLKTKVNQPRNINRGKSDFITSRAHQHSCSLVPAQHIISLDDPTSIASVFLLQFILKADPPAAALFPRLLLVSPLLHFQVFILLTINQALSRF